MKGERGRGTLAKEKPPILGMIQRGGQVVIRMLANVQQATIAPLIRRTIAPGALVYTDEYDIYARLEEWGYGHETVCHAAGEYARDDDGDGFCEVHVNTMEGFRALLRSRLRPHRGISQEKLPLDLGFFEARVLPIFEAVDEGGQSCLGCHRSHTILRLVPRDKEGRWTPEAVRANYRAALRVVDLANPSESLLLNKPTWDAAEEAEAQGDPTKKAHGGGIRFEPRTSAEYQALLDWINGARLPAAAAVPEVSGPRVDFRGTPLPPASPLP